MSADIAVATGVRADIWHTAVPSLAVVVCEPYQASGVKQSEP
ncbi:MAG: hypothetical protein R2711_18020 [Acidimicrobiales bacterium]